LASRQAWTIEEFKTLSQRAMNAYQTASKLFEEISTLENKGRSAECLAAAEYARYWGASDFTARIRALDECCTLCRNAIEIFRKTGNDLRRGEACNLLSLSLFDRTFFAPTFEEKKLILQEAAENANDAVTTLSKTTDENALLLALSTAGLVWFIIEIAVSEQLTGEKCLNYSKQAIKISERSSNPYSKAKAMEAAVWSTLYFSEKIEDAWKYANEMWKQASIVKDNQLKGIAGNLLSHIIYSKDALETDQDKRKQMTKEIIRYAKESIRFSKLSNDSFNVSTTYIYYGEAYCSLARDFPLTPKEKLALIRKAVRIGEKGLKHAVSFGSPDLVSGALHGLSKAFQYYSKLEPVQTERTRLLRKALSHRKHSSAINGKTDHPHRWNVGVDLVYAAQIEAELSKLENNEKTKLSFLKVAVADMERGVSICTRQSESLVPWIKATAADYEDTLGRMLNEHYLLTEDEDSLTKANKAHNDAAEKFKDLDLPTRVAESYWRIARNLDLNGEHQKAAENFEKAFAAYKAAAQKNQAFSEFYLDYASYMKAWSEIQCAKLAHETIEYSTATKNYKQASDLLNQSKSWRHLSPNFNAWAHFELGEDYSRKENCRDAVDSFVQAVRLFQESKRTLEAQLQITDKTDEKDLVTQLINAAKKRVEYCQARIQIEEARILDKQGSHTKSSEKYKAAADNLERISQIGSEQTRKEAQPLIYLCRAWQKMTMAEARNSSALYGEAAEFFKLANDYTLDKSASFLSLGHSSFCEALKAITDFENTRDTAMFAEAKDHMDSASNFYLRAGFEAASEYAKAMLRLFDAYAFMASAKRETDPEKQARHYLMADKVLQKAIEAFSRAEQGGKIRQVQQLLEKVRDERELALSLSEVLHAPTFTSSTASFATIGPVEEEAVGLERFEHADIQAKIIQYGENIALGEEADFGIQMMNVGKEPVFLTRIENILPENFQLTHKPDNSTLEDADLIIRGKRLEPLKISEIGVTFRPFRRADAEFKSRIVCVDETGRRLLIELEPKILHVSETVLPGRIDSGFGDLDSLLLGGIPENYALILVSPSCDEREIIINEFLKAGTRKNQITFCVLGEPGEAIALTKQFPSSLYIFLCNPREETGAKSLPNVFNLKGVENLTDIDIALTKSFRMLDPSRTGPKRAYIEITSDVLLQHHALTTRKWLSGLLSDLRAKGFTTLAVINPLMHPPEEAQSIIDLFDGVVEISEKETGNGVGRILRVGKLRNQRYLENEIRMEKSRNI
jgi:hypothetical protein